MHFLMTSVGSSGDVHPYIGMGRRLRQRGHDVTLLAADPHRPAIEAAGLGFASIWSEADYQDVTHDPDLWHPRRGLGKVLEVATAGLDTLWRELEARYEPGRTMIVGHPLAFGARAFEEKFRVPALTIHLAPGSIRSAHQVTALPPGVDISGLSHGLKRAFWWLADRAMIDPKIAPALNRWRAGHGLRPVHRIFHSWLNSPQGIIGLFPSWFGSRQPDWPARFHHASFPLHDDVHPPEADPELDAFLDGGPPPIVFSPGSANRHAQSFFAAGLEALQILGMRGLFLTGFPEQLPGELPDSVMHRHYLPFSTVLPRSAAFVHHGGIGSTAQGLAAGIPQLMMPMGFDQPDNSLRAERLGVARWLSPRKFTGARVARTLESLLGDPGLADAARILADRLRDADGIGIACDVLERHPQA
ncbi:MAG: glycosyltransferase [Gemmatimonadota bacterium]|nr:glycosyltransferase [Gemmatimonadota bacterium]